MKKLIPFAHASSIFDVNPNFFTKNGIRVLLIDLDNTLDSYKLPLPSKRVKELVDNLKAVGVELVILSNNSESRVNKYASSIGVNYIYRSCKPFPVRINKYIKEHNLKKEEVMVAGDQIMTDVLAGNRAMVKTLLTEKIVKEDQFPTRINRIFDKPIRNRLSRKKLLVNWNEK